jgi:hypothetical protein
MIGCRRPEAVPQARQSFIFQADLFERHFMPPP